MPRLTSPPSPLPASGSGVAALLLAVAGFSWGFIIVKALGLPPITIAFWRLLIGVTAFGTVAVALGTRWPADLRPVIAAGIFFGAHQLLFITATQLTSIAIVTLVAALQPLVVNVLSRRLLDEVVPQALRWWALVAVAGVALVLYANLDDPSRTLTGDLLSGLNLLAFTAFFLFSKRARQGGAPTLTLTSGALAVALLVVSPTLLLTSPALPELRAQWLLLAVLALVPGSGHLLVNWAHTRVSAALASMTLASVPVLSSVWAHLAFGEPFGSLHVIGMVLVGVAIEGGRRASAWAVSPEQTPHS